MQNETFAFTTSPVLTVPGERYCHTVARTKSNHYDASGNTTQGIESASLSGRHESTSLVKIMALDGCVSGESPPM